MRMAIAFVRLLIAFVLSSIGALFFRVASWFDKALIDNALSKWWQE